jgi:hypothetical protein
VSSLKFACHTFITGPCSYVISLGYLIVAVLTIPLGYLNLDDNIYVQIGGIILLTVCVLVWVAQVRAFICLIEAASC